MMTEEEFVATVRNGIEAYVCNETKLFKSNQGDYDFAEALVDHLILNGNLPLDKFSAAQCALKDVEIERLTKENRFMVGELNTLRNKGVLTLQQLSGIVAPGEL